MKIRFKKLSDKAVIPTKAHDSDAGFDLTAVGSWYDDFGNLVYGTGIAVEIPKGYVGLVFPRSSICKKDIALSNSVGVIDSGYRGEILCKFKITLINDIEFGQVYASVNPNDYKIGERLAQLIVLPYPEIEFEEADELSETDRGTGGYGSTGK